MNTSTDSYYLDQNDVPLLDTYVYFPFYFAARYLIVANDDPEGTNQLILSFNGTDTGGKVNPTESFTMDEVDAAGIWLKYNGGAPAYRVMARPE